MKPDPGFRLMEKLLVLLELEREAEKKENLRELRKYPVASREALGKTVTGLTVDGVESGIAGMPLLVLSREPRGEELAPFHALGNGDNVLVTFPAGSQPQSLEGTMYRVEEYRATVALAGAPPQSRPRGACQIDLLGSDATYQRMRKALVTVSEAKKSRLARLRELSLGQAKPVRAPKLKKTLEWFNPSLNEFQREAVAVCLAAEDLALVHGPPGTGKTTVLVEVIRQHAARGARILATAPSNVAVDNMLEKLHESGLRVVRLGHPARTLEFLRHNNLSALVEADAAYEEVRELDAWRERLARRKSRFGRGRGQLGYEERQERERELQRLWRQARDLEFEISRRLVAGAQVVLATHGGLSRKLLKGRFDLAALDEASQATEPLSWVALQFAEKAVLAGDSMQLPPTIYSREAAEGGLAVTLFDRLKDVLPAQLQTLLRVQYRMHETIMGFSSRQFYEDKLIADESVRRHLAAQLPGVAAGELTNAPLVFIDTAGAGFEESWNDLLESRENAQEAELAARLLARLLQAGLKGREVALLTPYVAQARRLKSLVKVPGVEIGSIDGFQGREKEATIVSLVRSNDDGEVGFLGDTRRMNVALTRARRLLIVIGDSATLAQHPFYSAFIEYVDFHGAHRSAYEFP
ncbi:MAG: AAA family ATPase [Elusimicrobia bacterium]|nr:AAA family ATPase [Elusimicrobiota bacterium]MDE2426029.1 AAA family ATPase [Elusimicrobiota bacterium]